MRQLFLLLGLVIATCEACARTRGGGRGPAVGTPGSPAPGSPGAETPVTEAPSKACPPLTTFAPDPPAAYQLVSPPTTAVSGDTTTATCPAGGTSFLLPDGTSTTATLSCSTATGSWSFSDDRLFDASTTSIACGAKCAPCMVSQLPLDYPYEEVPTVTDATDQCNTPIDPACTADYTLLVGANMDGTLYTGNVIVAPVSCVGGKWVDASNAVYENLACSPPSQACTDLSTFVNTDACNTNTGKMCVAPTDTQSVPYTGTNALLAGEMTLDIVCPPDNPILYLSLEKLSNDDPVMLQLNTPLSPSDANFLCQPVIPVYLYEGVIACQVVEFACAQM